MIIPEHPNGRVQIQGYQRGREALKIIRIRKIEAEADFTLDIFQGFRAPFTNPGLALMGQKIIKRRHIKAGHSITPFRGDYSTDAPRGAREGTG
jgi:hypothetical protein